MMTDYFDDLLVFDIFVIAALVFAAGVVWWLVVRARAPREERHID
jgi:hypothetical protein